MTLQNVIRRMPCDLRVWGRFILYNIQINKKQQNECDYKVNLNWNIQKWTTTLEQCLRNILFPKNKLSRSGLWLWTKRTSVLLDLPQVPWGSSLHSIQEKMGLVHTEMDKVLVFQTTFRGYPAHEKDYDD